MILLSKLCLLAIAGLGDSATVTTAEPEATTLAAPQQPNVARPAGFKPGGSMPSGGTPEPASILLLVGGALGYGAFRLTRRNSKES